MKEIISGLKKLKSFTIQCVLIDGKCRNVAEESFQSWIDVIKVIEPAKIQIYSTDRPVAEKGIIKVHKSRLDEIAKSIEEETGIIAKAY